MRRPFATILLFALGLAFSQASTASELPQAATSQPMLSIESASREARQLVAWVIETDDNKGLPFVIIDKINAKAFAFGWQGVLIGAADVLLGVARGDDAAPDIGERALSNIFPEERITPAGRFVAALGVNLAGKDILWVDYDAALSLHRVVVGNVTDHRQHRLATATALDNRISYGCINVPAEFYETVVRPLFSTTTGIVYILPETRSIEEVFFTPLSKALSPAELRASGP